MSADDLDPRNNPEDPHNPKVLNREVFYRGKDIIEQGDEGSRAYYIESGRAEVLINDDEGHELKVAELGPGDIFGEMSLISNETRSATVRAMEDCSLTTILRSEINGKIKRIRDPAIRALINVLAERLRESTKGQLEHYKNLADFQDRVTGLVDRVHVGIDEKQRDKFREDVTPLLEDLQKVLDRYQ